MLDLTAAQLSELRAILARHLPHREVRVFGSRVTGRAKPYSDLDLIVMGEAPLADLILAELHADLEESDLPFRVDVLLWPDVPSWMREEVRHVSIPIQS